VSSTKVRRVSGWTAVTLDSHCLYPTAVATSDTGNSKRHTRVECIDDEQNGILHVVQGRAPDVGSTVKGRIDC